MKLSELINRRETAPEAHAPILREGVELSALSNEALASEILQLQKESDPAIRSQGLWRVAAREELGGNLAFATEAYAWLTEHGTGEVRAKAGDRLRLTEGQGSFGYLAENMLRSFAKEASDPGMLLAMGVGGSVYKATKLATMSRLVGSAGYL